jgi:DNA polymerase-3 subunit delta'
MLQSIVGHGRLVALLSRAVARNTLPPSLLFSGPAGVGKRRTAVSIAQTLNCPTPVPGRRVGAIELERDACGTCTSCRRIGRGVHPDVLLLEPDGMGSIKIEAIRDVVDRAGYRPFEARRRAVIIDEADAMQAPAQSALLKTLEEPPSSTVFLLVSSRADALLPTVLSRCPRLRFGALTSADVAAVLVRDHGYTESDALVAASDADGSVGRALAAQTADVADVRVAAARVLERAARTSDPSRRLEAVKELTGTRSGSSPTAERDHLAVGLRTLSSMLRDLGLLAEGADARMLVNTDVRPQLEAVSAAYGAARSSDAYTAVDTALAALERNANPKVVADWLVLKL